jgi:hypothetical protein
VSFLLYWEQVDFNQLEMMTQHGLTLTLGSLDKPVA